MAPEPAGPREARELRLEGATLAIAGGLLVALLVGAFALGRWVERSSAPARASSHPADPLGNVEEETVDAAEKVTFFDTLSGQGKEAEPKREATQRPPADAVAPSVAPPSSGPWYVQVFVGRDRAAAEEVVRTLRGKGYAVRTDAVSEGRSGSLYKVRVGGFPTKDAADAGADKLHLDGQSSTWVVRVGS
jgi:cell division septation protein DedD